MLPPPKKKKIFPYCLYQNYYKILIYLPTFFTLTFLTFTISDAISISGTVRLLTVRIPIFFRCLLSLLLLWRENLMLGRYVKLYHVISWPLPKFWIFRIFTFYQKHNCHHCHWLSSYLSWIYLSHNSTKYIKLFYYLTLQSGTHL